VLVAAPLLGRLLIAGPNGDTSAELTPVHRFGEVAAVAVGAVRSHPVVVASGNDFNRHGQPPYVDTLQVWEASSQRVLWSKRVSDTATAMTCGTLNGDPVVITYGRLHGVRIWGLEYGAEFGQFQSTGLDGRSAIEFTTVHNRETLLIADQAHHVRVVDLLRETPNSNPLRGHTAAIKAIKCITFAGRVIAVTGSVDQTVRIWDLATSRQLAMMQFPREVNALSLTPDGTIIVGYGWEVACFRLLPPTAGLVTPKHARSLPPTPPPNTS
jgi:WD40 repeat protein